MSEQKIDPPKITKPIQLLSAWLVGLILINGSFLATATTISTPTWTPAALVVASIMNVPLFLICLFLLQTKFRPEMQEDVYYAKYLEVNTGKVVTTSPIETLIRELQTEISEYNHRNAGLFSSFESHLKLIAQRIGDSSSEKTPIKAELLSIADEIEKSARAFELKSEQASVELNELLPDYSSIRRELRKQRIVVNKTFGSTSEKPEVPKYRIISFGRNVPKAQLRDIVQICQNFGFDLIKFSNYEYNEGKIYIGSYSYQYPKESKPVSITDSILKQLSSPDAELDDVINEIESIKG